VFFSRAKKLGKDQGSVFIFSETNRLKSLETFS